MFDHTSQYVTEVDDSFIKYLKKVCIYVVVTVVQYSVNTCVYVMYIIWYMVCCVTILVYTSFEWYDTQ